jgi:hypothetical protein
VSVDGRQNEKMHKRSSEEISNGASWLTEEMVVGRKREGMSEAGFSSPFLLAHLYSSSPWRLQDAANALFDPSVIVVVVVFLPSV